MPQAQLQHGINQMLWFVHIHRLRYAVMYSAETTVARADSTEYEESGSSLLETLPYVGTSGFLTDCGQGEIV
jgi:hypothetical protein